MLRIYKLTTLQELSLENIQLQNFPLLEGLSHLTNNLVSLKLTNCHLTSLKHLNHLTSLRLIKFSANQIDFTNPDNHLTFLMTNPLILELSNQQLDLNDDDDSLFQSLPSRLESVQLRSLDIKDGVFRRVVRFLAENAPGIKSIDFEDNLITDEGVCGEVVEISADKGLGQLERLNLSNNNISTQGALMLIEKTKIKELILNENKIATLNLFQKFGSSLQEESPITALHLSK